MLAFPQRVIGVPLVTDPTAVRQAPDMGQDIARKEAHWAALDRIAALKHAYDSSVTARVCHTHEFLRDPGVIIG